MTAAPFSPRVAETFTTGGTGSLSLLGAVSSAYRSCVDGVGTGNGGLWYAEGNAGEADAGSWEFFYGVATSGSPDTLTRAYIFSSTNSDNAVSWTNGATKTVINTVVPEVLHSLKNACRKFN